MKKSEKARKEYFELVKQQSDLIVKAWETDANIVIKMKNLIDKMQKLRPLFEYK